VVRTSWTSAGLSVLPQAENLFPTLEFGQTRFQFGTRKVPGSESDIALAAQPFIKANPKLHDLGGGWCHLQQGKERILRLGIRPGPFVVVHEHGLRLRR